LCYHADGNGNVTYMANSSQAMVARYRDDPFGNTISSAGSLADVNLYRFSSKRIDPYTGFYYYGYRWYAPNLRRWLTRDPSEDVSRLINIIQGKGTKYASQVYQASLENLYVFNHNSPTRYYDSDGLVAIAIPGAVITAGQIGTISLILCRLNPSCWKE